jgi:hypothetical protein
VTDRIRCKTPDCEGRILPSTAERTGGFCMPCVRRTTEERARKVISARVDVDRFAGIEDPVEILLRIHRPPPRDERTNYLLYARATADVYRSLGQADVDRLVRNAAGHPELLRDVANHLACFSSRDLTACQSSLLHDGDPYPAHAFRGASELVVHRLLAIIDGAARRSSVILSHALGALAWSGSPRAELALRRWREEPPSWRGALHWPPERYALVAGYELEDGGGRRELVLPAAHKLSIDRDAVGPGGAAVFEPDPSGKVCPQCRRPATLLLRIDAARLPDVSDVRLSARRTLLAPTCIDCAVYERVFVRFSNDRTSWEWLKSPTASSAGHEQPLQLPPTPVTLTPREAWAAADWCIADGISQIGGHPSLINEPIFPTCPGCTRTMMTVAQVAPEDFVSPAEGVFYVHVCDVCPTVGVSYDQS